MSTAVYKRDAWTEPSSANVSFMSYSAHTWILFDL